MNVSHHGRNICQIKQKYLEKLYANVNIVFKKHNLPSDLHIAFEIIKLLIMKGNLNLIQNQTTHEYLHIIYQKKEKIGQDIQ